MARWYGSFDNSTIAELEAATATQRRQRRAFTSPSGPTLQSALITTRNNLSSAFLAQIDAANRDGALGIVVPEDGFSLNSGNFEWTNLYTNADAEWVADPRVRPLDPILVAGSTAASPTDSGSIADSLRIAACDAVEDVLTALQVRTARTVLDEYKMLASIYHDHALTYFAWNDFTPGTPQDAIVDPIGPWLNTEDLDLVFTWTPQFPADLAGDVRIFAELDGPTPLLLNSGDPTYVSAAPQTWTWTIPGSTLALGEYTLTGSITFRDQTITTHFGGTLDILTNPVVTIVDSLP